MKPILLTMQAFGSYGEKTEIDFQKGGDFFLISCDTGSCKKKRTLLGGHRGIHALPSGATRNCRMNVKRWNS